MSRPSTIAPLLLAAAGALVSVAATSGRTAGQDVVPLTRSDLTRMLAGDTYTSGEVARMVRRACVGFRLSDGDLRRFRDLGATGEVMDALVTCREDGDDDAAATARLVLPDSVTARAGDTAVVRGRVERRGRGVSGVPVVLETVAPRVSDDPRLTAATSGPGGEIVFRVPTGPSPGRFVLGHRAASVAVAGSPRVEIVVRPGPVREGEVRPSVPEPDGGLRRIRGP